MQFPNFTQYIDELQRSLLDIGDCMDQIEAAAEAVIDAISGGNTVFFCGNGGSAADAQHLAAEMMGRFLRDRNPLPAVALTVDTSVLTAIANDYSYEDVFSRQLRGLGKPGDVLVGISTSGNSANVLQCMSVAETMSITTIGLTGRKGNSLATKSDVCICVPSDQTNHIQEMHIMVGHFLCGAAEASL